MVVAQNSAVMAKLLRMVRALLNIVARRLADLDVHVHAAEVADCPAVEQVAQGDQRGGLARLP